MRLSIIIPTLNEEDYLPKLLASIRRQDYLDYEVIVGDGGSDDKTCAIARSFGARVVHGGRPTAAGRNAAARVACGEMLLFLDSDVILSKGFLRRAIEEMDRRMLDVATCLIKPISSHPLDKLLHEFANSLLQINQYSNPHAPGFCIISTKRLFDRIGGFDETLTLGEDHDYVKRASRFRQFRILYSITILVSVRRLKKEGRFELLDKYTRAVVYSVFKGPIRKELFKYESGNFRSAEQKRKLYTLERRLNKLNYSYRKILSKAPDTISAAYGKTLTRFRVRVKAISDRMVGVLRSRKE